MKSVIVTFIIIIIFSTGGCCKVNKTNNNNEVTDQSETSVYSENDRTQPPLSEEHGAIIPLSSLMERYTAPVNIAEGPFSGTASMYHIKNLFGKLNIKQSNDKSYCFVRTSYNGLVGYLFYLFDKDQIRVAQMLVYRLTDVEDFKKGDINSLDDVRKIDPGVYLHKSLCGGTSYHYCFDGTIVEVNYLLSNNSYVVSSINYDRDPEGFVKLLHPEDLKLINTQ